MTPNQERIRRAARELNEALNADAETKYEIGHYVVSHQTVCSVRTRYSNALRVVATNEGQVFP